jgi:endoglucanase
MHTSHIYAPGPWASYLHAAQAAQGAHVLRPLNARLATFYRESAARAWQWAEGKMADQDYVRQMIPKTNEQRIREGIDAARTWAAAELYRLTGEESYKTAFVKQLGVDPTNKRAAQLNDNKIRGVISYVLNKNVPDDDPLKVYLKRSFVETSHNDFLKPMKNYPYSVLRHSWAPFGYGNGTTPGAQHYLRIMLAYVLTGDRDALAGTCDSGSFILGANQANTSMITGLGQRPVRNPHHEDMANMGVAAPNGIVVYGFATHEYLRRYHWVFYPKWAMLSEKVPEKSLVPTSFGWPPYECFFDTFGIMVMTEYTIQQSMTPCALMYGLLDALAHGHQPKTVQR